MISDSRIIELLEQLVQQNREKQEKLPKRQLEEPTSERSIMGMGIGLTESLETNTKVLKHFLKGTKLVVETYTMGSSAKTKVNLFYLEDLVDNETLFQVKAKFSELDVKYMFHPEVLVEELHPKWAGLFPTVRQSERFDTLASDLMQGKVVVIADHNPFGIVAPVVFWGFFQTQDEYYNPYGRLTNRFMRMFGFLFTMYLPAIYVATSRFHMEDIKKLHIGKKQAEELAKFIYNGEVIHALPEMIFILLVLRIIYDTSLHVYKSLTVMITFLAILIIGQFSVSTHFISAGGLVIAAFAQLGIFLVLTRGLISLASIMQWWLMPIGYIFGYTGLAVSFVVFFIWGACLKPFGVPYFSPLIPFRPKEWKDTFWRGKLKKIINSKHTYIRKGEGN